MEIQGVLVRFGGAKSNSIIHIIVYRLEVSTWQENDTKMGQSYAHCSLEYYARNFFPELLKPEKQKVNNTVVSMPQNRLVPRRRERRIMHFQYGNEGKMQIQSLPLVAKFKVHFLMCFSYVFLTFHEFLNYISYQLVFSLECRAYNMASSCPPFDSCTQLT
jgi:hypothetical protein